MIAGVAVPDVAAVPAANNTPTATAVDGVSVVAFGTQPFVATAADTGAVGFDLAVSPGTAPRFDAVVAGTSSPAAKVALLGQPARPMQIGTHAPQGPGLGGAFLALVLVLGLILGLAWLLKRLPGGGFRQADGLRVIASIPLGGKERAAVVQVGGEQLLLGIGAGGVRTLHVLPAPLPEAAPVQLPSLKSLPDFKQMLAQRLRKDT